MNHIYRIIWSKSLGTWLAVSEITHTSGKHSSNQHKLSASLLVVAFLLKPCLVEALPTGGELAAGQAVISLPDANTLQIQQSSQKAVLNWQGFSIAGHETVNINQPDPGAAILNRVVGQDASQIQGKLNANGQVYLVNPNGVVFGKTAQVDVGGLIATTHNITNADFLNGKNHFTQDSATGSVENHGIITTPEGGVVALIGQSVTNTGTINTAKGTSALAAGKTVDLDFKGDGLVEVKVSEAALNAQIANKGAIQADGGRVILTAKAAGDLLNTVINNEGSIQARSLVERNGQIYLDGGDTGTTQVSGTLDASGNGVNETGGQIVATGNNVIIDATAKLDASGSKGGGEVLVGGSWQNSNPAIRQATTTTVQKGAILDASATDNGKGGTVVAWSDVHKQNSTTQAHGTFLAKGGANGGDGGRIETSGHWLATDGITVDSSATQNNGGTWLLDPSDVIIGPDPVISGDTLPPFFPFVTSTFFPTQNSVVLASTISNALSNNSTVIITTQNATVGNGDITVLAPITKIAGLTSRLELQAARNININSAITSTGGALDLRLTSDGGVMTLGANIATNGGYLAIDMLGAGSVTATTSALDVANLQFNSAGQAVNWTLDNPNNTIGTVAANLGTGLLKLTNNQSLTVDSVTSITGTVNGINSTGSNITLEALAGDLILNQAVTTNNALITLAAGGNFINNMPIDTGIVPTGTARYLVYSLDPATTQEGMSAYNKHYNQTYVSGVVPAYAATGNWFLYAIAPNITITPGSQTQVYGTALAPFTGTMAGFIDGDTSATPGAIDNPAALTFGVAGIPSSSGNVTAGLHDVAANAFFLTSSLGYSFFDNFLSTNEVNITPKTLTITGATGVNKAFDSTTTASVAGTPTLNGLIALDSVTVSPGATGNFPDANVGTGKAITVNAAVAGGFALTGTDVANYTLQQPTGVSANIDPLPAVITPQAAPVLPTSSSFTIPNITPVSPITIPSVLNSSIVFDINQINPIVATLEKVALPDLKSMVFSGLKPPILLDKLFEINQGGLNSPTNGQNLQGCAFMDWSCILSGIDFKKMQEEAEKKAKEDTKTTNSESSEKSKGVTGASIIDWDAIFQSWTPMMREQAATNKGAKDDSKNKDSSQSKTADKNQTDDKTTTKSTEIDWDAIFAGMTEQIASNKKKDNSQSTTGVKKKDNSQSTTGVKKKDNSQSTTDTKKKDNSQSTTGVKKKDNSQSTTDTKKKDNNQSTTGAKKKTDTSKKIDGKVETEAVKLARLKAEEAARLRNENFYQERVAKIAAEKKAKEEAETAKKKAAENKRLAEEKTFLARQKGAEELKKTKEAAKKAKAAAKSTKLLAAEKDKNTKDLDTAIDFGKRVRKAAEEAAQAAVDAKKAADAAQEAVKDGGSKDDAKAAAKAATQAAKDAAAAAKDADEVMKKVNEMRSQADAVYAAENELTEPNRKTCGVDTACQDKVLKNILSNINGSNGLTKLGTDPDGYSKMILKLFLEGRLTLEELKAECSALPGCDTSLVTEDLVKRLRKAAQDAQDAEIVARAERVKKEFEASLAKVKEERRKKEAEDFRKTCQSDPNCVSGIANAMNGYFGTSSTSSGFQTFYKELAEAFLRGDKITSERLNDSVLKGFGLNYNQSTVDRLMATMEGNMMGYKKEKEKADKKAADEKALAEKKKAQEDAKKAQEEAKKAADKKAEMIRMAEYDFRKILEKKETRSDKRSCSPACKDKILYYGGWDDATFFTVLTSEGQKNVIPKGWDDKKEGNAKNEGSVPNPMFQLYDLFFNNTLTVENVITLAYASKGLIDPTKITPEYVQDIKDRLEAAFLLHADGS